MTMRDWNNIIDGNIKQYDLIEFIRIFATDSNYFADRQEAENYYWNHI